MIAIDNGGSGGALLTLLAFFALAVTMYNEGKKKEGIIGMITLVVIIEWFFYASKTPCS